MQGDPHQAAAPAAADSSSRGMHLLLTGVVALALVGFLVGMRQGATPYVPSEPPASAAAADGSALPAMSYHEYHPREHGPNRDWRSHLEDLAQAEPEPSELVAAGFRPAAWSEEERAAAQAARAQSRAFPGAPPVVPHPTDQLTSASCIACHASGLSIAGVRAPAMSHGLLASCTQCHVEQRSRDLPAVPAAANSFAPHAHPVAGTRAWPGAPPTIPHPTFLRENCAACHGPAGIEPFRSSHPWQASCLQCHAPSAALDQGVFDARPAFLPPPVPAGR